MITSPVVRFTSRLLRPNILANFSFEKAMYDPSKHIYMNHIPHNMYLDYWDIGQYPELIIPMSVAPRTYEQKIVEGILQTIHNKYNIQLKKEDIINENIDYLLKHVFKTDQTPEFFLNDILRKLSTSIFVRESKWTWIIEQQHRYSAKFNENFYNNKVSTIQEFLATYNQQIEKLVLVSHFGTCSKIPQSSSPQQKHFFNQINDNVTGVSELDEENEENNTFVNRLMRLLHRI